MLGPTLLLHITAYLSNRQEFFTFDYRFDILRTISCPWSHTYTFLKTFQTLLGPRLVIHTTEYLTNCQEFVTFNYTFKIPMPKSCTWSHTYYTCWKHFIITPLGSIIHLLELTNLFPKTGNDTFLEMLTYQLWWSVNFNSKYSRIPSPCILYE